MASKAEPPRLPVSPGLRAALSAAGTDFYFNSLRLVAANVLWGATLLAVLVMAALAPVALLLVPILAFPTAWTFRLAALLARDQPASFWDGLAAWHGAVSTLLLGIAFAGCGVIFIGNIVLGLGSDSLVGWALATLAFWGLVAEWLLAWTVWPLLLDPTRAGRPIRERLRLAVLLLFAYPRKIGILGLTLLVVVAISTIAFVALLTVAVAFAALVAARFVLPAADRLEARLAERDTAVPVQPTGT